MPTHHKLLIAALSLPLALGACSGSGDATGTSPRSPGPAGSTAGNPGAGPSLSAHPTFSPGYPAASIYIVTAGPGVTDQELKEAMTQIAEHEGVNSVSFIAGKHQLRVEMSLVDLVKRGRPVYDDLTKLGTVTTP